MNLKEFIQMLRDFKLIGPSLTVQMVMRFFCYVQVDNDKLSVDKQNNKLNNDDLSTATEMVYEEFKEGVLACVSVLYPNPYIPLHHRLDTCLQECIYPAMREKMNKLGKKF